MIKLERPEKPRQLSADTQKELTETYLDSKKPVWQGKKWLKDALLTMSNNKCCYCEAVLEKSGSYMEVEHYKCKAIYPELVLEWGNLLPSCKRCNGKKGEHDVMCAPILDPTLDEPRAHLQLINGVFFDKTHKGRMLIELLYLNEWDRVTQARCRLSAEATESIRLLLVEVREYVGHFADASDTAAKLRLRNKVVSMLKMTKKDREHSAAAATAIIMNEYYTELSDVLKKAGIWDAEMEALDKHAQEIELV